jgi:drug/metabolite transporter (DMT)-like permease
MIILGSLILKEKVSKEKWIAVFLGMIGICIALQPSLSLFQAGGWIVLVGTWLGALNKVYMRRLAKTEHTLAITLYPNILMLIVSAPFLFSKWIPLPWHDIALFSLVGVLTAAGQYAVAQALRYAKASSLAPIDYSSFLWVILLDFSCFNLIPHFYTLIGIFVIITSNIYLIYCTRKEENKKKELQNSITELSSP